jgi:SAM-dependent methyltransferase
MKTYTSMRGGLAGFARDAGRLYKVRTKDLGGAVRATIVQKQTLESEFAEKTGNQFRNQDVLVLGAGQTGREVVAFGIANRVTAIDLDVIPQGWRPGPYLTLLKENGAVRTAKTVGRKALGIDYRFTKELCASLGVASPTPATYLQMDASNMSFGDASFDLVYSFSVFEHLPDPEAVLQEAIRVLRPGGLLSISVHLYSSEGGCHDLRIFAGDRADIPFWAHLRPVHKDKVIESCFMNEWTLAKWRVLFDSSCPGGEANLDNHHEPYGSELASELKLLRANGELSGYTDEDLLSVNYRVVWRKP